MRELPTLRSLTRELRAFHAIHEHPDSGGEYMCLVERAPLVRGPSWVLVYVSYSGTSPQYGREYVPGDGAKFDAVAAARRLLAAWRDSGLPA